MRLPMKKEKNWAEKGEALARNMREEYELGDEQVRRIITNNYLDRLR